MELTINEQVYTVPEEPERMLLWVLRDELGLVGTRYGCGAGICGACTVLVDGQPRRACITKVADVAGQSLQTVEGLAVTGEDGRQILHPVQQAFIEEQVPQCAWCMSGQMMTAVAFLAENPDPTPAEVVAAMQYNYCRCGCYARIRRGVARAAVLTMAADSEVGGAV